MAPSVRGGTQDEADKYKTATDAKHLLDIIGKDVYEKAKKDAEPYINELQGHLSQATYPNDKRPERTTPSNPCNLEYEYHTNVTSNVIEPCKHKSGKRLSEVHNSECDNRKIRDSDKKNNSVGACAPYRRLHVCDKNIQQIKTENITTHNLLADVCQAAKFEGQSIRGYHPKYEVQYPGSGSSMCTMLARSFADIGDIIRGKDLFIGNNRKGEKLEAKIKEYFQKIYKQLVKKKEDAQTHYSDSTNFYQLREDWWNINRKEVWKAITCEVQGFNYFRHTCNGQNPTQNNCRCPKGDQVPTYFDYVPQFLRWFEEWAEDFCRKRKKKIENAIKNCRGDNGKELYCDLNGYDCVETVRGKEKLVEGADCKKCSVACNPFVPWMDNQQKEFEKQKNKYAEEIKKANGTSNGTTTTTIRIGDKTINNLYVGDFYEKLEKQYGKVENFLGLLNKEGICQSEPKVGNQKADAADFTESKTEKTFSRTKYCRACPLCGVNGPKGNWTDIEDKECTLVEKKKYDSNNTTNIDILTADKSQKNILQKYNKFCKNGANDEKSATPTANGGGQIKNWQCYYDESKESGQNNNCILGKWEDFTGNEDVTSYNVFFYNSIIEMLNDSIEWKDKLNICINNKTGKCRKVCKNPCECYKRWIEKKKTELEKIKDHFRKQKDIGDAAQREMTLNITLNNNFLNDIKDAYPVKQQLQKIEERLKDKMQEDFIFERTKTSIDKFLQEEEQFAEKCIEKHKCQDPQPSTPAGGGVARSDSGPRDPSSPRPAEEGAGDGSDDASSEDEEEEEEEEEEDDEAKELEEEPESKEVVEQKEDTTVNVCKTVEEALNNMENLNAACDQKYSLPQRHWGWRCVTPTTSNDTTREAGKGGVEGGGSSEHGSRHRRSISAAPGESAPSSDNKGGLCIPPRRRRLYVGKLHNWASGGNDTQVSGGDTGSQSDKLREAFIESAAVETFFLWHKYKTVKQKELDEKKKQQQADGLLTTVNGGSGDDEASTPDPQTQLQKSGTIPPDFLRLMFYTLGDYRDILYSGSNDNTKSRGYSDIFSGDNVIKERESKIQEQLKKFFQNSGTTPSSTSGKTPQQTWWDENAQHIWNGMICALTYKENEEKTNDTQKIKKDDTVYKKFFGENNNKNPANPVPTGTPGTAATQKGTYQSTYKYETVELKEENETKAPASSGEKNPPKLSDFVLRPTYFRYLEEWGETFCRQRARMLEKIKLECRSDKTGKRHCSGDGHICDKTYLQHNNMFADFVCRDCHKQCRNYKKWIDIKFVEFHEQKNTYEKEHKKLKDNSKNDGDTKKFCTEIKEKKTAAEFLKELKHCKDDQNNSEEKDEEDKKNNEIKFEDIPQTFSRSTYCETCPLNGVTCNGRGGTNPCTPVNGNNWESVFNSINGNGGKSSTIEVEMIDRRGPYMKEYMEKKSDKSFKDSYLFKSVREQNWTCKYKGENMDVCKLDQFKDNIDLNQYTTFKVLLHYWLEDFLYGYYLLKTKKLIEECTKSGGNTCDEKYQKNCVCVKKWVDKKKNEWEKIKEHYNIREQQEGDTDMKSLVRKLLEQLQSLTELNKIMKPCTMLDKFKESLKCNSITSSENSKEKDIVECMLEDLDTKIKTESCPDQPSVENPAQCEGSAPLPDEEEELLEEDEQNTVGKQQPSFCPEAQAPPQEDETDGTCDPAPPVVPKVQEEKEVAKDKGDKETEQAAPAPAAPPPSVNPTLSDQPTNSISDILSSTIPFGIAIALTSIALLFLK
ncbi:hypothetical protein PFFVO_04616, partial [Plasmodium falciparum Vietnam Oak-Knoll (FVO)]